MLRDVVVALLLGPVAWAQTGPVLFTSPSAAGSVAVFGSALSPEGATLAATELWTVFLNGTGLRRLTHFPPRTWPPQGITAVAISSDGAYAVYTNVLGPPYGEEVHRVDLKTGADQRLVLDTEGCLQPACPLCYLPCLSAPHFTADGRSVLYSVRRNQPFRAVRTDGAGMHPLPVYTGALAPSPQRVLSRTGTLVFTSAAPSGPTFAPSATNVYRIELDGSGLRELTRFGNDAAVLSANATVTPDGALVAFESNRDPASGKPSESSFIYTVKADGTGLTTLGPGSAPSIAADGSVAFVRDGQVHFRRSAITSFQTSAAQDVLLTEDGTHVLFALGPTGGAPSGIYTADTGGSGLRAVYAPRSIESRGVEGGVPGALPSPGSLITVRGTNLAAEGTTYAPRFPLPATLAGLSLLLNGNALPLLAVTPWHVIAQVPPETRNAPAALQLRFADGMQPAPAAADMSAFDPWIYASPECVSAYHADATPVDAKHPAKAGEVLASYWTGLGITEPLVPAGTAAPFQPLALSRPPDLSLGAQPVTITFSGLTPGMAGLYQVNFAVPSGLKPGPQQLGWRAAGSCALVWVQ